MFHQLIIKAGGNCTIQRKKMKTLEFTIEKGGSNYTITHEQTGHGSRSLTIKGKNLYNNNMLEPEITGYIEDGKLKFSLFSHVLVGGVEYNGFTVPEDLINQIEASVKEDKEIYNRKQEDRAANRIAPYIDRNKFEVFNVGCDTGMIYHSNEKAIKRAIEAGAKVFDVLRGERDNSNKYPGQMDDYIPVDYATKNENGKHTAVGYSYVYAEHYCIEADTYKKALEEIETEAKAKENKESNHLQACFQKAKETGEPVLISKIVVSEEDSPLRDDGEGDMVDICQMAMPDGTIKEMYFHNY